MAKVNASLFQILPDFKSYEDNKDTGLIDAGYHGTGGPVTVQRYRYQPAFAWDILEGGKQIGYNVSDDLDGKRFNGFAVAQMTTR